MSDENHKSPPPLPLVPPPLPLVPKKKYDLMELGFRAIVIGLLASIAYDLKWGEVDVGSVGFVGQLR